MIADLLEPGQHPQDVAAPRQIIFRLFNRFHLFAHRRFIERGLFRRQAAIDLVLELLRQIVNDRRVGFQAAQDEGRGQLLERGGGVLVAVALDRQAELFAERVARAEIAGVEELRDRPEFAQAIFDGRAGQGQLHIRR